MSDAKIITNPGTKYSVSRDAEKLYDTQDVLLYRERQQVAGAGLAEVARVTNSSPAADAYGLVVRIAGSTGGGVASTVDVTDRAERLLGVVDLDDALLTGDGFLKVALEETAGSVPVLGPLTNTELRAAALAISVASLPLPSGAATESTLAAIRAKTDNLDVLLSSRAVTGLTDTQLRATPVPVSGAFYQATQPVSAVALPLPAGAATAAKQDTVIANLQALNSLVPAAYDYVGLTYTGDDLTGVAYKSGGAGGTVVSTLTLAYSGGVLQSVTKS